MSFDLGDYVDVSTRLANLKAKFPDARVRVLDAANPYRIETIDGKTFIVVVAACYRTADDPMPATGMAWEPYPGKTPYTRDSELQNAETSAWGRAIVAALASESKSIASQEDVRNRQADADVPEPLGDGWPTYAARDEAWDELKAATYALDDEAMTKVAAAVKAMGFTKATFSRSHATAWESLIPADSEAGGGDHPSGANGRVSDVAAPSPVEVS